MSATCRVIQKEQDQTAGIVWEAAYRALNGDSFSASILHQEPSHWNLSYNSREIPGIPLPRQERRFSGGGEVLHDGTICAMRFKETPASKQGLEQERHEFAEYCLRALEENGTADSTLIRGNDEITEDGSVAYYDPLTGDIYKMSSENPDPSLDPQIMGLGFADLDFEFEEEKRNVIVSRACFYEKKPEAREIYPEAPRFKRWQDFVDGIEVVENAMNLLSSLEDQSAEVVEASNYVSDESRTTANQIVNSRDWEIRSGKGRNPYSCF